MDYPGFGKAELARLLDPLEAITVRHFREEEAMLTRQRYPQLEIHKGAFRPGSQTAQGRLTLSAEAGGAGVP